MKHYTQLEIPILYYTEKKFEKLKEKEGKESFFSYGAECFSYKIGEVDVIVVKQPTFKP